MLTLLLVALLAALAGRVLLLLTGLRLPALLLLSRPLLAAALLLTGLLVGPLRWVRILVRIIHLSTSWVKIQHNASNDYRPNCKLIIKISMQNSSNRTRLAIRKISERAEHLSAAVWKNALKPRRLSRPKRSTVLT